MTTKAATRSAMTRPGGVSAVDAVLIVLIVFTAVSSVVTQPFWGLSLESPSASSAPAREGERAAAPRRGGERTVSIDGEPITLDALMERLRHAEGTFRITVAPVD